MSRLITTGTIILLILGLSLGGIAYAGGMRREMERGISEASRLCREGDGEGLRRRVQEMETDWEKRQAVLSIYVRHDELEKMSLYLAGLKSNAEAGRFDDALHTLGQMSFLAEHIYSREFPNLNNVL